MSRPPRFPDVDWYCDHCGSYLNAQEGFDDHKYIWKCTQCKGKNSISRDNIHEPNYRFINGLLDVICLMRTICLHCFLAFAVMYLSPVAFFQNTAHLKKRRDRICCAIACVCVANRGGTFPKCWLFRHDIRNDMQRYHSTIPRTVQMRQAVSRYTIACQQA